MEDLCDAGKIRANQSATSSLTIWGCSLLETAAHQASVNKSAWLQVSTVTEAVNFCRENILLEAWGPFGQGELFQNPDVQLRLTSTIVQIALA